MPSSKYIIIGREPIDLQIQLPSAYKWQQLGGKAHATRSSDAGLGIDPDVMISATTIDVISGKPEDNDLRDENCQVRDTSYKSAAFVWQLVQTEARPDGVMLVCQLTSQRVLTRTEVFREMTWFGHPVQCAVSFAASGDPRGEPSPTPDRIEDAKAICDTLVLMPPGQKSTF